jgi:hypothetical protein
MKQISTINMNSILPIRLTIPAGVFDNTSSLSLICSFNNLTHIFRPPFRDLPVHLINFPTVSSLSLKFFDGSICLCEGLADLKPLIKLESLEISLTLSTPSSTTNFISPSQQPEIPETLQLCLQRSDIEKSSFTLNFDNLETLDERILEISFKNLSKNLISSLENNLGIELLDLENFKEISPQQLKYLRWLILGINEKLKVFQTLHEKYEESQENLEKERKKNEKTLSRFREACSDFLKNKKTLEQHLVHLQEKQKTLETRAFHLESIEKDFEAYKLSKSSELALLSLQLSKVPSPPSIVPLETLIQSSNMNLQQYPALEDQSSLLSEYQASIESLTNENHQLQDENERLKQENQSLQASVSTLGQSSSFLQCKILELESRASFTTELESQLEKIESQLSRVSKEYQDLQEKVLRSSDDFQEKFKLIQSEKDMLFEANSKLNHENALIRSQLIETEKKLLDLQSKSYESTQETSFSFTEINKQNLQLLQDSKDFCEISNKLEKNMLKEYNIVVSSLLQVSGNHLMLQRLQSKILSFLRDKEAEILELKTVMGEIQKQKVAYIPVRGDYIDNQLANFLNSMPVPCEVPFTRLEPGVYLFGTKRIVLRVENIGIVIRVGGGFIKLEDYINNQTGFEVGRMKIREAKDKQSKQRFSKPSSPEKYEIDRTSSPTVTYAPRTTITTGIPMPKTVSTLLEKKISLDISDKSEKRGSMDSSIPLFSKRASIDSGIPGLDKKSSVDLIGSPFDPAGLDKRGDFSSSLIKPIPIEDSGEKKSRIEFTRKSFLTRKNTTG